MENQDSLDNVKFETDSNFDLPERYGDNKIVLMVRDPWTMFSYWEVRKDIEESVLSKIRQKGLKADKSVLRVYELTKSPESPYQRTAYEFELRNWVNNWYIHVDTPGGKWVIEIGILSKEGEFFSLARSNQVTTPPHKVSDIYDGEWMYPEGLRDHLNRWLFSGGVTSNALGAEVPSNNERS